MSQTAFSHEAMLYATQDEFLDHTAAFVREGAALGEPVLVVVAAAKIAALRSRLGRATGDLVAYADMATVGENPARIITAWRDFVDRHGACGRRLRGIGEPVWAGRSATELDECRQHEALLDLAFTGADDFTLRCPYDTATLDPAVIAHARATHPAGVHPDTDAVGLLAEPLAAAPPEAMALDFGARVAPARRFAAAFAATAGFTDRVADVTLVVAELVTNSVRHGGGTGTVRLWTEDAGATLVCEVGDRGRIVDPMIGRHRPHNGQIGGRGLWMVNQLCHLVQVRSTAAGSTIRTRLRRVAPLAARR